MESSIPMLIRGNIIESAPLVIISIFFVLISLTIKLILFQSLSNGNSARTSNFCISLIDPILTCMPMYVDVFSTNLNPTSHAPYTNANSSGDEA
jgi:hypothetical protein